MDTRTIRGTLRKVLATGLLAAAAPALAQTAAPGGSAAAPQACAAKAGVERQICVECSGLDLWRRIGCEQRTFWTLCKGTRWMNDPYCRTNREPEPRP